MNEKNVIKTDKTRGQTENAVTQECGSKNKGQFRHFNIIYRQKVSVRNSLQTLKLLRFGYICCKELLQFIIEEKCQMARTSL